MNDKLQGQEICTPLRFYEDWSSLLLVQEYKLLDRFVFLCPNIFFEFVS